MEISENGELKLQAIHATLKEIERTLAGKSSTTNETRIGALRRISDAIGYINTTKEHYSGLDETRMSVKYFINILNEIKDKLLGR